MDILYQLQGVEFDWMKRKARSNLATHGVTFEEAAEVFFDPFYQGGDASTEDEAREFIIGYSLAQRLLSARQATRSERKLYEETSRRASIIGASARDGSGRTHHPQGHAGDLAAGRRPARDAGAGPAQVLKWCRAPAGCRPSLWGPGASHDGPRSRPAPPIRRGRHRHYARNPRGSSGVNGLWGTSTGGSALPVLMASPRLRWGVQTRCGGAGQSGSLRATEGGAV